MRIETEGEGREVMSVRILSVVMCLQAAQVKKEKEALKKALRKERKTLRAHCKVRWVV